MPREHELDGVLRPESIAVVGAAREKTGAGWVDMFGQIVEFGYQGRLYPINPKADVIRGHKAYPDLTSLPETADLVIIALAAWAAPAILEECVATGHRNVHIFSAGFGETGEEDGQRLQKEIEQIAQQGGLRVVGPNSMGVYSPGQRLVTWANAPVETGEVGILAQSGGFADAIVGYGSQLGLAFSTVVNYGSGLTLDATDFIDYFADDPETSIIGAYLEGVTDGRRLLEVVRTTARSKPVVIAKPGRTRAAARAAASHTGSLAGDDRIWEAFFAQSGAIRVDSVHQMAQTILALLRVPLPTGRGVAILGTGGGSSVSAADSCGRAGLDVPRISQKGLQDLRTIIPTAGNIITNPIDAHDVLNDVTLMPGLLEVLAAEQGIDMIIVYFHIDWMHDVGPDRVRRLAEFLAGSARDHLNDKPLVATWRSFRSGEEYRPIIEEMEAVLLEGGVPVFPDIDAAVGTLARLAGYHEFLREGR